MNGGVRLVQWAMVAASCLAFCLALGAASEPLLAQERAVLRRADVDVTMTAPTACDVRAALTIDAPGPITVEHRLQLFDGGRADAVEITGAAAQTGEIRQVGRTLALTAALDGSGPRTYTLRYRVTQADAWIYRCPLWLPTTPTDGVSREVHLQVQVPPGASPTRGAFPAFTWTDAGRGTATIGHLPVFVRVPFQAPGQDPGWLARQDLATVTDITAVVVLVVGTLIWVWRARR